MYPTNKRQRCKILMEVPFCSFDGRYLSSCHSNLFTLWHLMVTFLPNLSSLVAQMVKHLPTMRETQVRSLGWEDPLEKEIATHSSTLAWKITWTEELEATVHGVAKSQTQLSNFIFFLKAQFLIISFKKLASLSFSKLYNHPLFNLCGENPKLK